MLTIESTIVIPQQTNSGQHIDENMHLDYLTSIASCFGGYTEVEGAGGWLSDSGVLYHEKVYVITISTPLVSFFKIRSFLRKLALIVKRDLAQESVYINIGRVVTYFM